MLGSAHSFNKFKRYSSLSEVIESSVPFFRVSEMYIIAEKGAYKLLMIPPVKYNGVPVGMIAVDLPEQVDKKEGNGGFITTGSHTNFGNSYVKALLEMVLEHLPRMGIPKDVIISFYRSLGKLDEIREENEKIGSLDNLEKQIDKYVKTVEENKGFKYDERTIDAAYGTGTVRFFPPWFPCDFSELVEKYTRTS